VPGVSLEKLRFGAIPKKVGPAIFVFLVDLVCFVPLVRLKIRQKFKAQRSELKAQSETVSPD
jgi:hypothetical protein